jgi:hypothetical protein
MAQHFHPYARIVPCPQGHTNYPHIVIRSGHNKAIPFQTGGLQGVGLQRQFPPLKFESTAKLHPVQPASAAVSPAVDVAEKVEPVEFTGVHGPQVKRLVHEYTTCKERLRQIPGVNLHLIDGRPPYISSRFMQTEEYSQTLDRLSTAYNQTIADFRSLVGVHPHDSDDFAMVLFDKSDAALKAVGPEVFKASSNVVNSGRAFHSFLLDKVSLDLKSLRLKVLGLWEGLTGAMCELRCLQNQGVNIGTAVFPFHPENGEYAVLP